MRGDKIIANFSGGKSINTTEAWQWDYGLELVINGLDLPFAFETHYSNQPTSGETTTQIGQNNTVIIPDIYLTTGDFIYAFIYLHDGEDDGETEYRIIIPVKKRPKPTNYEPTPVQQDAITEAIAALDAAVEQTAADVVRTGEYKAQAEEYAGQAHDSAIQAGQSADAAAGSEATARGHAQEAERQAGLAEASAQEAERQAGLSADSAEDAEQSAERAEQAATTAGFMWIEIVDGHLVYTRTDQVDADFSLSDTGHLILESVA